MSPYRQAPVSLPPTSRRTVRTPIVKTTATLIASFGFCALLYLANTNPSLLLYPEVITGAATIIATLAPGSRLDARQRLCRIRWSCGDRGTAVGVYIGWIPLRYSQKRIERNARAVERFVEQRRRERHPWIK